MTDEERFWSKVKKSGDCWVWSAYCDQDGYGKCSFKGKRQRAHRVAWQLAYGGIPEHDSHHGMCVCHKCDNPSCVRPDHLFLGTNAENLADMKRKGRQNKGSEHHLAKLDEADVMLIKELLRYGVMAVKIAKEFNVSKGTITYIKQGHTWKHI